MKIFKEYKKQNTEIDRNTINEIRLNTIREIKTISLENIESNKIFSINDMMLFDKKSIEDKVFIVPSKDSKKPNSNIKYVQIRRTNYIKNNLFETIIQIIDISDSIFYDQ